MKTPSDLDDFRKMLTKVTVETALNAELDELLGYEKH
ncbi:IS256 family transposase, partial [Vibrio splendidus]